MASLTNELSNEENYICLHAELAPAGRQESRTLTAKVSVSCDDTFCVCVVVFSLLVVELLAVVVGGWLVHSWGR